jgi:hypothetical protein
VELGWHQVSAVEPEPGNAAGTGSFLGPSPEGGHEIPVAMPTYRD